MWTLIKFTSAVLSQFSDKISPLNPNYDPDIDKKNLNFNYDTPS